jgi:hypothetical protein
VDGDRASQKRDAGVGNPYPSRNPTRALRHSCAHTLRPSTIHSPSKPHKEHPERLRMEPWKHKTRRRIHLWDAHFARTLWFPGPISTVHFLKINKSVFSKKTLSFTRLISSSYLQIPICNHCYHLKFFEIWIWISNNQQWIHKIQCISIDPCTSNIFPQQEIHKKSIKNHWICLLIQDPHRSLYSSSQIFIRKWIWHEYPTQ